MPAYDTSFTPPAPVADVTVAHPVTGISSGALRGKLDSGADVTVGGALRRGRKHLGEQAPQTARVVGEQAIDPTGN